MVAVLVESSRERSDELGALARRLRRRFPKSSVPTAAPRSGARCGANPSIVLEGVGRNPCFGRKAKDEFVFRSRRYIDEITGLTIKGHAKRRRWTCCLIT